MHEFWQKNAFLANCANAWIFWSFFIWFVLGAWNQGLSLNKKLFFLKEEKGEVPQGCQRPHFDCRHSVQNIAQNLLWKINLGICQENAVWLAFVKGINGRTGSKSGPASCYFGRSSVFCSGNEYQHSLRFRIEVGKLLFLTDFFSLTLKFWYSVQNLRKPKQHSNFETPFLRTVFFKKKTFFALHCPER